MKGLALSGLLVGCTFSTQTPGPDPDDMCPFDVTPEYIDPCTPAPRPLAELVDVTITGMAAVDTGNGDIVGTNIFTPPPSSVVDGVRVVWAHNFTIATGGTLRAYGDLPLVIVATGAIRIEGTLDASSNPISKGAGARNAASCGDSTGRPGLQCAQHGGSGGGGGGFGAAGGAGGEGGDTHDCGGGATSGQPGGGAGTASGKPTVMQGGCGGGDGQPNNAATGLIGAGGAGGGAIGLIAAVKIIVSGMIQAGGGGGQFGVTRAGGGGGGAGGMIFLESIDVDLQATSIVAANGGGGGGGVDNGTAEAGETGLPSLEPADGGESEGDSSGDGGDGGHVAAQVGTVGELADRGGGGGGGGVGYIRVHQKTGSQTGMASPPIAQD